MIERSVDDEYNVGRKTLPINKVLRIRNDCQMAHDNSFGTSGGTRGIEHIGRTFGNRGDGQLAGYLVETLFGNVMLQGSRCRTGLMNGHIFHQETYTLRRAERNGR